MRQVKLKNSILRSVKLPGQYLGGEFNQIKKSWQDAADDTYRLLRFAFCFPDTYQLGMSNLALKILYDLVNQEETLLCERVFAPWVDMKKIMEEQNIPLFSLENHMPVANFDCIGFSLSYELAFSPTLALLKLAGIPLRSLDRQEEDPIIIAGGPVTYNIEPMADFLDIVLMGEGEESLIELLSLMRTMRVIGGASRKEFLLEASKIKGAYVPSLYEVHYLADGQVEEIVALDGAPALIEKRIIQDMNGAHFPQKALVPNIETVHDRVALEVFRACPRGCRFCQAGQIYRPVREKSPKLLAKQMRRQLDSSGYHEVGLLSLSTSDYSQLKELTNQLFAEIGEERVNLSVPSLRIDDFSLSLMDKISKNRKSGLTFAPEAGTQRLRDVINKGIDEEEILRGMELAFRGGYSGAKLYFMLGLPTETDEDIEGIGQLVQKILDVYFRLKKEGLNLRKAEITVSVALFIPKPFTPFQWVAQERKEEMKRKLDILTQSLRSRYVKLNWHATSVSLWEAVLARGDRRLGKVLEAGAEEGVYLDSWEEFFDFGLWQKLMTDQGLDIDFYVHRVRNREEVLPWDHIQIGVRKEFLWHEYEKAIRAELSTPCGEGCMLCGVLPWGAEICQKGLANRLGQGAISHD